MYFTAYTPLFPYEVTMRMIPNFRPRGHGIYVFIRSDTKEDTECTLCYYYRRGRRDLPSCPFIYCMIKVNRSDPDRCLFISETIQF